MINICFCTKEDSTYDYWSCIINSWKIKTVFHIDLRPPDAPTIRNKFLNCQEVLNAEALPADIPLVLLTPQTGINFKGLTSLETFEHPPHATYMFGWNSGAIGTHEIGSRIPDYKIYIPTTLELHAHVCAAITLYDRVVKDTRQKNKS